MDTQSGRPMGPRHILARLDYVSSMAIAMGLGWGLLRTLEPWAAVAAWLLMGVGAASKVILFEFSRKNKKDRVTSG